MIERRRILLGIAAAPVVRADCAAARMIRSVKITRAGLAYVEAGTGEPLVMIHRGLQDYRFWRGHPGVRAKQPR